MQLQRIWAENSSTDQHENIKGWVLVLVQAEILPIEALDQISVDRTTNLFLSDNETQPTRVIHMRCQNEKSGGGDTEIGAIKEALKLSWME